MEAEQRNQAIKIGGIAVVVIVAAYFMFRSDPSAPTLTMDLNFVCVETGQRFSMDRGQVKAIPAKNPDTGKRTLLPCIKDDEGHWVILKRYRDALGELTEINHYVDPNTYKIKPPS